jgi:ATP-dependent Clp protease protease subunit
MNVFNPITAAVLTLGLFTAPATYAAESNTTGTITIPIKEYEELVENVKAEKEDQFWNMTFQQILDKENNNYAKAWEKYKFWNLRRISLDGPVNDSSVNKLLLQINTLNVIDSEKPITMYVDSPGGGVFAGFNLINGMNNSIAPINTVCDGWAMSMAAVVVSNGVEREANKGCVFMIHEVGTGGSSGQTTDHIKWAESIVNVENILATILSENSGLSVKDVRTVWQYETFYNAHETLALGFVDAVTSMPKTIRTSRSIPENLLPLNKMRDTLNERLTE